MSVLVTLYVQREYERSCDESLMTSAARLLDLAAHEVEELREHGVEASATALVPLPNVAHELHLNLPSLTYQVTDLNRKVWLRSQDAPQTSLLQANAQGFTTTDAWRVYTLAHPREPILIHVADSLQHRRSERQDVIWWIALPMLALYPLIAWLIRYITRRSLAPMEGLVTEIAERNVSNLAPVGSESLPEEMHPIRDSTNRLLSRLKEALDVERSLAANAAHELRTPLAAARLRLANALYEEMPSGARHAVNEAVASLDQLALRAEKLLQMSRAEATVAFARTQVDLGALICDVAEEFWRDPDAFSRLTARIDSDNPVTTLGDADAIALAVRNLVENALRHAPGSKVVLSVGPDASIRVQDDGVGVDATTLRAISTRHVRSSADRSGYGLGLSIVKTVVDRHSATMRIESPIVGSSNGFCVTLQFAE